MSDVFLSYASATEPQAKRIAEGLRALGYGVWRDDELPPHRAYSEVIEERLKQAKAVVVVWSADAAKSHWVRAEADYARNEGKLVQLAVDGTIPPMPFNQIQCVDLSRWKGDVAAPEWRKIADSVAELVGGRPAADATAPAHSVEHPARATAVHTKRRKTAALVAIVAVLLAAGGTGAWLLRETRVERQAIQNPSVAVTAFKALTNDAATRDFVAAADSEIVGALNENLLQTEPVGRATFIVEGSARTHGEQLLVRVSLRLRSSQVILWSTEFRRPVGQSTTLPANIAARTAAVLGVAVEGLQEGGAKLDPLTFALYVKGRDTIPVIDSTERLVRLAPGFAPGRAWRSVILLLSVISAPPEQFAEVRRKALDEAREALRLDPRVAMAYVALANGANGTRWAEREAFLRRCQAVALGSDCNIALARVLLTAGRAHEAVVVARRDRLNRGGINGGVATEAFYTSGNVEDAAALAVASLAVQPDDRNLRMMRLEIAAFNGSPDEALRILGDVAERPALAPGSMEAFQVFLSARKSSAPADREKAVATIMAEAAGNRRLLQRHAIPMLSALGATEEAFQLADLYSSDAGALRMGLSLNSGFLFAPATALLRADPRFIPIMRRLGLVDYWKSSGVWPDFCEDEPKSVCAEMRRQAG